MLLVILLPLAWLGISVLVVAVCRMAASADATTPMRQPRRRQRPAYSPRRPSTCGTVRSRILTSVHSDQLAT
jgi:hypothetical protein